MINLEAGVHAHKHDASKNEADVEEKLLNDGRCRKCGMQTHEVSRRSETGWFFKGKGSGWFFGKRRELRPLTNEFVLNGRCLVCHPLPAGTTMGTGAGVSSFAPPAPVAVPAPAPAPAIYASGKVESPPPAPALYTYTESPVLAEPEPAPASDAVRNSRVLPGGSFVGQLSPGGTREGHGTMRYANGDVYVGGWRDDKKHGRGRYLYADGGEFEGHWVRGRKEGRGALKYSCGDAYVGEWKDDMKDGMGTYTHADGGVYVGPWRADAKHGTGGVTRYANGEEYRGEYRSNRKHGRATYHFADGTVLASRYRDGHPAGEGVQLAPDRGTAWLLRDGELAGTVTLSEARDVAARIGIPIPDVDLACRPPERICTSGPVPRPRAAPCTRSDPDIPLPRDITRDPQLERRLARTSLEPKRAATRVTNKEREMFRKLGLCEHCGRVATHGRAPGEGRSSLPFIPLTTTGEVYRGLHLDCVGGIVRAKEWLGERVTGEDRELDQLARAVADEREFDPGASLPDQLVHAYFSSKS